MYIAVVTREAPKDFSPADLDPDLTKNRIQATYKNVLQVVIRVRP